MQEVKFYLSESIHTSVMNDEFYFQAKSVKRGSKPVVAFLISFSRFLSRVEETLLYHRLMMLHMLPCQPLDVPILLSPR